MAEPSEKGSRVEPITFQYFIKRYYKLKQSMPKWAVFLYDQMLGWLVTYWLAVLAYTLTILNICKDCIWPIYQVFFAHRHPAVVRTPESSFRTIDFELLGYNYPSKYLDLPHFAGLKDKNAELEDKVEPIRMHYIDHTNNEAWANPDAVNETVLLLHGEPTWSFLYRKVLPPLLDAGCRVIVPDMIGFGRSDKFVNPASYTHDFHMMTIDYLLDSLDLHSDVTLVCQDWGGLTGLSVLKNNPGRFSKLVIMNTGLPTGLDMDDLRSRPIGLVRDSLPFLVWRQAARLFGTRLPVYGLMRYIVQMPAEVAEAYDAPFPGPDYMGGAAKWPLMVPIYRDDPVAAHMVEARAYLSRCQKPTLLLFGDKDPITRGQEPLLAKLMPGAERETVAGASHFLQETNGEQVGQAIVDFLSRQINFPVNAVDGGKKKKKKEKINQNNQQQEQQQEEQNVQNVK